MYPLLVGTDEGVYGQRFDDAAPTCVLDGPVRQLERGAATGDYYAATGTGLYRSGDGEDWVDTGLGDADATAIDAVVSVHEPANGRLFAGT